MTFRFPEGHGELRRDPVGSVLIIVLWISFGLVSLALYFAHSMSFELRSSDNRTRSIQADQAIQGALRYASNILANAEAPGRLPDFTTYRREAVPVGESWFWFIGREPRDIRMNIPRFELADEASKLNLNTATLEMLERLPRMTPELAAAIVDWRDEDDEITGGGAESETYFRQRPSYRAKNGRFESIEELRLIAGMDLEILYGEDANLNGVLDSNENDGNLTEPLDNRDGELQPGLLEYVTVYSREPNSGTNGAGRVGIRGEEQELRSLLEEVLGNERANEVMGRLGPGRQQIQSLLEFAMRTGLSAEEFAPLETRLSVQDGSRDGFEGLINVNTAPKEVLACLPAMDLDKAASLMDYRSANAGDLHSVVWVARALDEETARQIGPFVTSRSYQFTVDVAALGRDGRGYRRVQYVLDTADGTPTIRVRRELTHLGWALGQPLHQQLLAARNSQ